MRLILIALLATCVGAARFYSSEARKERSTSDDGFEEKMNEGYKLLKNVPNEDATVNLLKELHNMEDEIKQEFPAAPNHSDDAQNPINSYGENEKDHTQSMGDTLEAVNHNSKVDAALFQGDMILTKEQAEEILEDVKQTLGHRHKRQAFRDRKYPRTLWSNGVHYAFADNATEAARTAFRKAAALWSRDTCIDFMESNTEFSRIEVIDGSGCWSFVGRLGFKQPLSLGVGCESVGTASHEIGHALGFHHTHSRHDRDDFIKIIPENFEDGWVSQYAKESERTNYNYNLTYDYGSIMHYGATSVSKNGEPIMVPNDPWYYKTLGSRMISFYDKLMMNLHYKCLDKCTANSSANCENGGFPHPRDCSKCICPSGYGGRLCNERPSGCGKTVTATTSYQTFEDRLNGSGKTSDEAYNTCNYWIEAPEGSKIEVILDSYSKGFAHDGCTHAGVEIKTGEDKRYTGIRICSPGNTKIPLVSNHNVVPVITYSGDKEAIAVIRYRIASYDPKISTTPSRPNNDRSTTMSTSVRPTLQTRTVRTTRKRASVRTTRKRTSVRTTTKPTSVRTTSKPASVRTTHKLTSSPSHPQSSTPYQSCRDSASCPTLMEWNLCTSPEYTDKQRKAFCPKSCGFC